MTAAGAIQHIETDTFDERMEILSSELELAVMWNRPSTLLAVYNSEQVCTDAETALEGFLLQLQQRVVRVQMDGAVESNLFSQFQQAAESDDCVYFIKGMAKGQANFLSKLAAFKDLLHEKRICSIFWLAQDNTAVMLRAAPDFWDYRQCIVEFAGAAKPNQSLHNAIESIWQGIGESAAQPGRVEETNVQEAEAGRVIEPVAVRAKLLLTLCILNWRKGDYEKAAENLRNALNAAVKLEDNLFEAECHNAIALVNFSLGRNDEAISAYKQAIASAPDQVLVLNNLGNLCMKISRNDEAMLAFQKTLKHNEKDPVAWNGLGAVYYALGYLDDSITAYQKAIEFAPALSHPWHGLGEAYINAGRDPDAISAFQKAVELNKNYVKPWLRLAEIYSRQGRGKDAVKAFQRALNLEPNDHQAWNDLGLVLLKNNFNDDAVHAFTKAIELNNGFGWAYCNLAGAYANQGRHAQSIEICRKGISAFCEDSDKAKAWEQLAGHYRSINDYASAMQAFQTADKLNGRIAAASDSPRAGPVPSAESAPEAPTRPKAEETAPQMIQLQDQSVEENFIKQDLTITHSNEEPDMSAFFSHPILKTSSAANASKKPISPASFETEDEMAETRNPAVWNEKGNVHFQKGSYQDAAIAYTKAIELDRSFGWSYSNLALTYLTLGKFAEAILLYQKSICLLRTNEEKAASWNSLGNIYRRLNKYEDALSAYQNADEVDPQNAGRRDTAEFAYSEPNSHSPQVWIELGNLFFKAASYSDAADAYAKAVRIDPSSGWAHSNLAMSFVFLGRYKEAVPVYLKSIDLFSSSKDKAVSWNRLGNVYRRMNDSENAKKAYRNAVSLSDEKESLLTRTRFSLLGNCYSN